MKRVLGIGITISGFMFLIKPDFDLFEMSETLLYLIYTYWPLFLICFGIFLQSSTPKKKRRQ